MHEKTSDELPDLGEIQFSTASLQGCTDCFSDLLANTPAYASGVLQHFKLRQTMSAEDAALAFPSVNCAVDSAPGACTATRTQLDDHLFEMWYQANISGRYYRRNPCGGWGGGGDSEGRYQGAFHFDNFDLSNKEFEYTAFYNGSVCGGYDETSEPVIPALLHRMASALYRARKGVELKVYEMGFPSPPHTYIAFNIVRLLGSWIFPTVLGFLQVGVRALKLPPPYECYHCCRLLIVPSSRFLQVVVAFQMVAEKATNMRELMVSDGSLKRAPLVPPLIPTPSLYSLFLTPPHHHTPTTASTSLRTTAITRSWPASSAAPIG